MTSFHPNLDQFPTLKELEGQLAPEILHSLLLDYQRTYTLTSEIDAERRSFKLKHEKVRAERDVLQTALVGLLRLGGEELREPYLEQILEIISRLAGAEVGALFLMVGPPDDPQSPLLITRHCTEADLAFIHQEMHLPRGVLRLAREQNQTLNLPADANTPRLLEDLHQRHVRAAIALPFAFGAAQSARGLLYLEHMVRADAFSGDLRLVHECLQCVGGWLVRNERLELQARTADHTTPFRRDARFSSLIGRSQHLSQLLGQLELFRTTRLETPVLLEGAEGVGKSVVAALLHKISPRATGPFVVVACGGASEVQLAELLFGDEHAAAYASSQDPPLGALERARGGTLCLKDVDRLSPSLQSRLLRALQERRFVRNHGEVPLKLEVRLVCSTRLDLSQEVQEGRFRVELADRLSPLQLRIAPLCERREDILPLADHFLAQLCRELARPGLKFTPAALCELERRSWPGNARELKDRIRNTIALCSGPLIDLPHLLEDPTIVAPEPRVEALKSWKIEHDEFQRRLIRSAMELSNRNVTQAARKLRISRQYLNNRLRTLGMENLRTIAEGDLEQIGDDAF